MSRRPRRVGGGWRAAPCETRGAGAPHGRSGAQARRVLGLKAARVAVHATVPQRAGTEHGTAPSGHVLPTGTRRSQARVLLRGRPTQLEQDEEPVPGTTGNGLPGRPFISWKHTVKSLWNADGPSSGL